MLALLPTYLETFFAIDPIHTLSIDSEPFTSQQQVYARVSEPWPFDAQLPQPLSEPFRLRQATAVPLCRTMQPYESAGSALTELQALLEVLSHRPLCRRAYHFFDSADFSASISSACSATIFLSLRFSSSS